MLHKPFLAKTAFCLREKEVSVFKFWSIFGLILAVSAAHSETQAPWFGSEAATAEQIAVNRPTAQIQNFAQIQDCAIYSCSSLLNIAMPINNSSTNP
jgi:hypothetical protein